jgi:hypothetical protein
MKQDYFLPVVQFGQAGVSMIFTKYLSQPTHVGIHLAYMTLSGPCLAYKPGKIGHRLVPTTFLKLLGIDIHNHQVVAVELVGIYYFCGVTHE